MTVYFELIVRGAYVKVAAIDAESGLEASIVGARGTPQPELERLALKKLDYVKRKQGVKDPRRDRSGTLT